MQERRCQAVHGPAVAQVAHEACGGWLAQSGSQGGSHALHELQCTVVQASEDLGEEQDDLGAMPVCAAVVAEGATEGALPIHTMRNDAIARGESPLPGFERCLSHASVVESEHVVRVKKEDPCGPAASAWATSVLRMPTATRTVLPGRAGRSKPPQCSAP